MLCTMKLGATFWQAYHYTILRYIVAINLNWCVNSVSHYFGKKPYDINSTSTEAFSPIWGILMMGEGMIIKHSNFLLKNKSYFIGWHNFHHSFPRDYKTSETRNYLLNPSSALIDLFAKLGWAYDLNVTSEEAIRKRVLRTGDGSHRFNNEINVTKNDM